MNFLYLVASISFGLWIVRNILFWVALLQLKEYRFDRILIHLRETTQGRKILFSPLLFSKIALIFLYGVIVVDPVNLPAYQLAIATIFCFHAFVVVREIYFHLVKRPVLTFKSLMLIGVTLGIVVLLYFFPPLEKFLWLLILDKLIPVIIGFFVLLLSLPTEFYRDFQIERAMKKMLEKKNVLVIGVTGSYGKSSTKEFIAQILQRKFKVLKTKGTNNTPIGIASTILSGLKDHTEIFVVEMGAYKVGEIAEMCQIVHPKIGILTAVNEQHLSLFGSLENTKRAKYELIESLPKDGLAIFNGNDKNARDLYQKTKKQKILYISSDEGQDTIDAQIWAENLVIDKASVTFDVFLHGKRVHMKAPLLGAQNVENILPGIYIADYLGMTAGEIQKAVSLLSSLSKTMIRYLPSNGVSLIDDTFNANPNAVEAVLRYAKIYKKKKIFVLQPMIELGKDAPSQHYSIGKQIADVCDYLFLTNKNFYNDILQGIKTGKKQCQVFIGTSTSLSDKIIKIAQKDDVVIFEGKEAGFVLEKMM